MTMNNFKFKICKIYAFTTAVTMVLKWPCCVAKEIDNEKK